MESMSSFVSNREKTKSERKSVATQSENETNAVNEEEIIIPSKWIAQFDHIGSKYYLNLEDGTTTYDANYTKMNAIIPTKIIFENEVSSNFIKNVNNISINSKGLLILGKM